MKAAYEHENESSVEALRRRDDEQTGAEHRDPGADSRALAAVGAGRVGSLDHAGASSLQRMAGNAAFGAAVQRKESAEEGNLDGSSVHDVVGKGGDSLDDGTRSNMESAFGGHDFSSVRVHSDSAAHESAKSVQARAYTVGDDIVLGEGVSPSSAEGQKTLAHELTHVVQQRSGPVAGVQQEGGVSVSTVGDPFEQEAEANADRISSGGVAEVASAGPAPAAATAQRHAEGEEASVQEMPLQREGPAEDEAGEAEEDEQPTAQTESLQRSESDEDEGEGE